MNAQIDITNVILHTDRLTLRSFRQEDLDDFYQYASVEGVGEMAGWPHHKSKEETQKILNLFIEHKVTFALVYENKVIGSIGIEPYDEKVYPQLDNLKGREIGYVLSKDYWGKGLMDETVNKVLEYLFNDVDLDFVMVGHFDYNNQSKRVIEKTGFSKVNERDYLTKYGNEVHIIDYIKYNPSRTYDVKFNNGN